MGRVSESSLPVLLSILFSSNLSFKWTMKPLSSIISEFPLALLVFSSLYITVGSTMPCFSACGVPGKNSNSSHATPFRRHVRNEKATTINAMPVSAGPVYYEQHHYH